MRRIVIGIGVFIIVGVAALLVFAATFDVNKYRGTIQAELQKRLGRQVALGDMHLSVFPPRFRVQNPSVSDDPAFSTDAPFVKAQELDVSVKLLPLLHKQVEIDSLELQRPSVNLIKNPSGTWNFDSLGKSAGNPASPTTASSGNASPTGPTAPGKPSPNTPPQPSAEQQFSLGELTIRDGQISVLDQQKSKTPSQYDHIDVTLKDFSPNHPFTVDASVHMAGSASEEARLQGEGGPIVTGQPETTPFKGTLSLKQVSVGDLSKFLNSPAANGTDGVITGDIKIDSKAGNLTAQGGLQVQNAKVQGTELGFPIAAQYDLTDDLGSDLLTIRHLALKLGATPVEISGTVNSKPTPALLDLNLKANSVSIAEAAKLAAASGMALSPGTNASGNVNANIQAHGAATKPALTGTIVGNNIQLSGKNIAQPVQVSAVNLNLTPSQIQSNPFNVISGGTTLNAQFTLRNYSSPSPTVDATLRAPGAQFPAVLAMAKAYGVTSLDKLSGEGALNLDMRASGPLKSVSSADIVRTLNGTLGLNLKDVKYSGANIGRELGAIAGFLNANAASQSPAGVTNISTLTGNVRVRNGIAETNDLKGVLDIGNVGVTGTANLADQTLNLRLTAVLSQPASQKVGGNSIGGFMQTALANNQGELVVPALVTGTFSNPRFAPDVQQIAQMKMKGLVPNLENPSSVTDALQNLLGGPKNAAPGAQGQQQNPQQNPVQQLMGLFGKKKKPGQPQK